MGAAADKGLVNVAIMVEFHPIPKTGGIFAQTAVGQGFPRRIGHAPEAGSPLPLLTSLSKVHYGYLLRNLTEDIYQIMHNLPIHQTMEGIMKGDRGNIFIYLNKFLINSMRSIFHVNFPINISVTTVTTAILVNISSPAYAKDLKFDLAAMGRSEISEPTLPTERVEYGPTPDAGTTVAMLVGQETGDRGNGAPPSPDGGPSPQTSQVPMPTSAPTSAPGSDDDRNQHDRNERRRLAHLELLFQVLNAADAATTISCVERSICNEQNPLYGSHRPGWGRIAGVKAGVGALHYLIYRTLAKSEPRLARMFELTTITIQGATVIWNMTITLK